MFWGDWGKPAIPASAQLAAELPYAVSILIIAPWFHHIQRQTTGLLGNLFIICVTHIQGATQTNLQ